MNAPDNHIVARKALTALAMNEQELVTVLQNSLYPGADTTSIALVINYCRAGGLDPMQKPVHIVPLWDGKSGRMRDVIMPGVGLYRTQAARTGELAGISEPEFGPDITETIGGQPITFPAWCRVVVKRILPSGHVAEFSAVERWKENYAVKGGKEKSIAPNAMWTRRPYAQLAKCTQAQAIRIGFPEMVGAAPTADEMEGKPLDDFQGTMVDNQTGEIIKQKEEPKALPPFPADAFARNLEKWRANGTTTPEQFIATLSTRGVLSAEQIAEIKKGRNQEPAATKEPTEERSHATFAQVEERLTKAEGLELLDLAADFIRDVHDEQQREELQDLYGKRRAELAQ